MQPYSELANWDGSLSDVIVDSLGPPSPPDTPSLPLYDHYHDSQAVNQQQTAAAHISTSTTAATSSTSTPSSSSRFDPSASTAAAALFPPASALSPQEREIMADITLDPDDPDDFERSGVASSATSSAGVTGGSWAWAALAPGTAVKNGNGDASTETQKSRLLVGAPVAPATAVSHSVPAPLAVSTSSSVSPSPFAPPPAPPASVPVSQSLPLPSSSSSLPPTVKGKSPDVAPVHPDPQGLSSNLDADENPVGTEYVMKHTSASTSQSDAGEAGPRGNSTADHLDALMSDPPDQPQPRAPSRQSPKLPPLDITNRSSSRPTPQHSPKTPLFLPSPSESAPPSRPPSDSHPPEESDPPDIISIDSSSSSSSPPPLRRLRRSNKQTKTKTKKQRRQLMAYVLIPPLPSGARKSNSVPLKKGLRKRKHRVAAKKNGHIGDNAGSSALVAALQGAFKNNSIGPGSLKAARRKRGKTKAVVPVEVVEVVDDEDGDNDEGELKNTGSSNLARALSSAFAHNSADPNVVAKGRTHPLSKTRSHPSLRTRAASDAEGSNNSISSRRRNEKRQPQTPTSPQKKKRRRLFGRGDGDDVDEQEGEEEGQEEIEIVDHASRELPRRASKTKPHLYSKAEHRSERSIPKRRRASMPSLVPVSARTSLPSSPSPSPPPESSTASPPDTDTLAGLPLTILPAPAATDFVIPARALNHLHASPGPLDPKSKFEMRHQDSVQGFHCEEAAVGAHGLLESPSIVAAISSAVATTTTTASTPIDSSTRANPTSPQDPPMNLGLDVIVPMDVTDGEQERQDPVQATVVPPHALRISSSTHPDGPMLGFMLSEHDDTRRTTSLSADTEVSSDGIGLELGAKTTADMDFMLLDPMDHNSALNTGPEWVDWHTTAPSAGLVVENEFVEFVGDGTIDPAVLGGGSTNKAAFRPDDHIRSHRSSPFMRAGDKDKTIDNHDSDDLGDEGDVMGLLFENSSDGGSSGRSAGGKGKDKDTATVDDADARQTNVKGGGTRKRRKSWRKTLADDHDNFKDTDTESHDTVARPYLSNVSNKLSSSVIPTFCHHCRRKTYRAKMCCTRFKESTGKHCGKFFCDLCIERRYPSLTFDEFATTFSCPCCDNFCNCTQCARARGETYIPERNGGWRRWAKLFPVAAAAATSGPTSPPRKKASRDGTREEAALTAQEADDTVHIVPDAPDEPVAIALSPSHSTSNPLISSPHLHVHPIPSTSVATTKSVVDKKRCRVYIGKWQRSWGRLVPVPDPDPAPVPVPEDRGSGRNTRKRKRAVRMRLFVGSEEPLLLSQKRARNKKARKSSNRRTGRRKKGLETEMDEPRQIASSLPPHSQSSSINASQNAALYEEHDPDADKGVWPGEYGHVLARDEHIALSLPPGVTVSGVVSATITPEELERAISAAFAVGMQF